MMDWKSVANTAIQLGLPLLGASLGGPAGEKIGALLASKLGVENTPDAVAQALTVDPQAAVKLQEIEASVQIAQITAASQQVDAVNKTLQTEAMGGSFWQRNHHAFETSFVVLMVAGLYIGLPLARVPVPVVDPTVWLMLGGILGVTAWQRGEMNKATVNNQ